MNFISLPRFSWSTNIIKTTKNVIGGIGKAVDPNGQNDRFSPLKIHVNIKGG